MTNQYSKEFLDLMLGPHRRPAYAINAPAVIRHVAIRLRDDANPTAARNASSYTHRMDQVVADINAYLKGLQLGATQKVLFSMDDAPDDGSYFVSTNETLFFRIGGAQGFRLRLRVDIHEEYISMLFLADSFAGPSSDGVIGEVRDLFRELEQGDLHTPGDAQTKADLLYDTVWKHLEQKMSLGFFDLPGEIFAEFRGLTICPPLVSQALTMQAHQDLQMPLSDMSTRRREGYVDDILQKFVYTRPKFFSALFGFRSQETETLATEDANVVLCGMLDGSAIYGSGLGKQSSRKPTPQRYFIIYNGHSAVQLGRLARRLHVLGELRIAALLDLPDLRLASRETRMLGYTADDMTIGLAASGKMSEDQLRHLAKRLTEIGRYCVGGLVYRVSRSRMYVSAYRDRIQDFRIIRIEGWQPYDEFVRRQLFKDFDYVSRVGERFDSLSRRVDRFNTQAQAERLGEYVNAVARHTNSVRRLQTVADLAVRGGFSYYVGIILFDIWCVFAKHCASMGLPNWIAPICLPDSPPEAGAGHYELMAVCFLLALILFFPAKTLMARAESRESARREAEARE